MVTFGGGFGRSWRKRLKREGDRTEPWGTPFVSILNFDLEFWLWTWFSLLERKFASLFLSLMGMVVLRILEMRLCHSMISKALLMSIAASVILRDGALVLKPSKKSCVRVERYVVVECCGRQPSCEGANDMCDVICFEHGTEKGDWSV